MWTDFASIGERNRVFLQEHSVHWGRAGVTRTLQMGLAFSHSVSVTYTEVHHGTEELGQPKLLAEERLV